MSQATVTRALRCLAEEGLIVTVPRLRGMHRARRPPADDFAEIERIAAKAGVPVRGADPRLGTGRAGRRAVNLAPGAIEHLAAEV